MLICRNNVKVLSVFNARDSEGTVDAFLSGVKVDKERNHFTFVKMQKINLPLNNKTEVQNREEQTFSVIT